MNTAIQILKQCIASTQAEVVRFQTEVKQMQDEIIDKQRVMHDLISQEKEMTKALKLLEKNNG
jgi:hypothetical protein